MQGESSDGTRARTPTIDPAWVALVEILARIDREPHHWPVGRTTFQKIAYFATESGLPTGLRHGRGSYGPFSPEFKPLLTRLVNNGLVQEEELGRLFALRPGPTFQDAANEFRSDLERWEAIVERIVDLFLRMRTQEAEVAATVFFAAQTLAAESNARPSEIQVLDEVKLWKQRRRPPLQDDEVASAIRHLGVLRWLDVQPSPDLPLAKDVLFDAEDDQIPATAR